MGTKKKVGKERLDKFYYMAKEQGYRSRAAFKLVQLAKKHDFFSGAQVCIDLCAAPGGWMQVAQKNMPIASKIIGIDLCPIKAIPGCTAIQADITTQRCRNILKKELSGMQADIVLHDGAPNTGTSWTYDAYVQNELVLHSFKLATEFLRPNGHFITKVFRSADYNALLWVFQQLFHRVEATKPQASRNVSAEIFVMCMGYKNPSYIDPKFFDPLHVFAQEDESSKQAAAAAAELDGGDEENVSRRKKAGGGLTEAIKSMGKRNRGGYEDGDDHKVVNATEFMNSDNPAAILVRAHKIDFDTEQTPEAEAIRSHPSTTEEIRELASDPRILGKRDLTNLLTWRYKYLRELALKAKERRKAAIESEDEDGSDAESASGSDSEEETTITTTTGDEEEKGQIAKLARAALGEEVKDRELQNLLEERRRAEKRASKKQREKDKKHRHRMMMSMSGFAGGEDYDPELFHATPDVLKALELEDKIMEEVAAKAKAEGRDIDEVRLEFINNLNDSDEEDEDASDEELDTDEELMDEDEKRFLQMERQIAAYEKERREDERVRKTELRKARKERETRREKVTAEWANEITAFDRLMNDQAEQVMKERNEKEYYSSDESDSDEETTTDEEQSDDDSEDEETMGGYDSDEDDEDAASVADSENVDGDETSEDEEEADKKKVKRPSAPAVNLATQRWLDNPLFRSLGGAEEPEAIFSKELDDSELPQMPLTEKEKNKIRRDKAIARTERKAAKRAAKEAAESGVTLENKTTTVPAGGFITVPGSKGDNSKFTVVPRDHKVTRATYSDDEDEWVDAAENAEEVPEHLKKPESLDELAQIQALGQMMIHKRTRMDLIDGAWNRFMFHDDEDIPDWFLEDDLQHSQPQLPLTKEIAKELRKKYLDIAARPIRKEAEAAARKKRRAEKKFERAKKAAEIVNNDSDMPEASKAAAIRKIMKTAHKTDKKTKVYSVGNKAGGLRDGSSANRHVKNAQTVVVDKRLKKDKRGAKFAAKKGKAKGKARQRK